MMTSLRRGFEALLWNSRLVVLLAVASSVLASLVLFCIVTLETVRALVDVFVYILSGSSALGSAALGKESTLAESISRFITLIDGYLLGAFLLIFGFGFYELFVADLQPARESSGSNRVLVIKSLDDLKERLGKVILLIMIVEVFKDAVKISLNQPLDLLYVGASVAFIALGLYLTHASEKPKQHAPDQAEPHG
jgi:uncharacterized membrane protein YqhA